MADRSSKRRILLIPGLGLPMVVALTPIAVAQGRGWEELLHEGQAACDRYDYDHAATVLVQALAQAKVAKASRQELLVLEQALGGAEHGRSNYAAAESHFRSAIGLLDQGPVAAPDTLARLRLDLAASQASAGRLDEAEVTLCRVLETAPRAFNIDALHRLALVAFRRHRYIVTLKLLIRVGPLLDELAPGPAASKAGPIFASLAWIFMRLGQDEPAMENVRHALRAFGDARGPEVVRVLGAQAEVLRRQRRFDEVETLVRHALATHVATLGQDHKEILGLRVSLAESRLDAGNVGQAEKELAEIGALAESRGGLWVRVSLARARVALVHGDPKAARTFIRAVLDEPEQASDGLYIATAWRLLSRVERADRAYARAAECARRAAYIYRKETDLQTEGAQQSIREFEKARKEALEAGIDKALIPAALTGLRLDAQLEPGWERTDAEVKSAIGRARKARKDGDPKRALEHLERAERLRPGEWLVHYIRAFALDQAGRTVEAVEALDTALGFRPGAPSLYSLRAALSGKLERYDRMVVDATLALLLGGDKAGSLFLRGMGHHGSQEYELALANFAEWKEVAPTEPRARVWHAKALARLGRLAEAEDDLLELAGEKEHEVEARLQLALLYRQRGERRRALDQCSRLIKRSPEHPTGIWLQALLHFDLQAWTDALADMERYEKLGAEVSLRLWLHRWLCLRHTTGREAADAALRKGLENVAEGDALARVAHTVLANDVGALKDVLAQYASGSDELCEACFYLGAWREAEGDVEAALALFERAVALNRPELDQFHGAVAARARLLR